MNLNLYKEYDIVTKYGCFDYEFFIIISVLFFNLQEKLRKTVNIPDGRILLHPADCFRISAGHDPQPKTGHTVRLRNALHNI